MLHAEPPCHGLHNRAAILKHRCCNLEVDLLEWHDMLSTACYSFAKAELKVLRGYVDTLAPELLSGVL
jgi:hypothetical protein